MELWDVYSEERIRTGRTMVRGRQMKPGDYHLIVHIAIINSQGQMLIQRRQLTKKGWAGKWDISVGGCAMKGESSKQAAQRELQEELGIDLCFEEKRAAFTINFKEGFDDIYIFNGDYDLSELSLQENEVLAVKWVKSDEIMDMIDRDEFVPYPKSYIRLIFDTASRPVYL